MANWDTLATPMKSIRLVAPIVLAGLALSNCGFVRPSDESLARAVARNGNIVGTRDLGKSEAKCVADVLARSGLSNATLRAIAKGDHTYSNPPNEAKILVDISEKTARCRATAVGAEPKVE